MTNKPDTSIAVCSTQVNQATELSVEAVPVAYEVRINDDVVCVLNQLENARTVYNALVSDMKGAVYHGKESKAVFY